MTRFADEYKNNITYVPRAIRNTRITRMIVGFMGIKSDLSSSKTIPKTERNTIATSN